MSAKKTGARATHESRRTAGGVFDRLLEVRLADRPLPLRVGQLAQRNHDIFFEYDDAFLQSNLTLSPLGLPLRDGVHQESTQIFQGLHGLFQDSLPDGWGLRLMDREFARRGRDPATVTPTERLQFLGTRAMGALTYHPPTDLELPSELIVLSALADQATRIYEGSAEEVLSALVRAGGSPAGARPKVLVAFNANADEMRSGAEAIPPGFQAYLVKFPTAEDGADIGAVEMAYSAMARAAGIDMPATRLFDAGRGRRCFGVERFDRIRSDTGTERRHVHTLGGLLHTSHREFGCSYSHYLDATAALTRDRREVIEAFRRMVFNVLASNRNDHVRNVAFLMEPDGGWRLTPAYNLVYASGPQGEHSMMIGSAGGRPTWKNFREVAATASIEQREIVEIVDQVESAVLQWRDFAVSLEVAGATLTQIERAISDACTAAREGR